MNDIERAMKLWQNNVKSFDPESVAAAVNWWEEQQNKLPTLHVIVMRNSFNPQMEPEVVYASFDEKKAKNKLGEFSEKEIHYSFSLDKINIGG